MDGASSNRRLIKLHQGDSDMVYKVTNPYSEHGRPLYFVSDPPHLVKTVRNCWSRRPLWVYKPIVYSAACTYTDTLSDIEKWEEHSLETSTTVV